MCGIAGIVNLDGAPLDVALLARMAAIQRHRGPDGRGLVLISSRDGRSARPLAGTPAGLDADVGLAHRRLAIIDVEGGDQPMCDERGSVWLTFNGEIYDFRSLRARLERSGHAFRTRTDTETIVHLYEEEGPAAVRALRGMFAFGLWDSRRRRLLLARDRLGKKPLYWFKDDKVLLFASELKALLLHPRVPRRLSLPALRDFLTFQYVPAPASIFEGIGKLPAAHVLVLEEGRCRIEEYWDLPIPSRREAADEAAAAGELLGRLREAVAVRMVSDVPLGAFLSGGIDSSSVVALMSETSADPVRTFSVSFENDDRGEIEAARRIARRFGTIHEEIHLAPAGLGVLEDLAWQFDEPFADSSLVPQHLIAKAARRSVTVCLTGDGGDEMMAGYAKYRWGIPRRPYDVLPPSLREAALRALGDLIPPTSRGRFRWRSIFLSPEMRYGESTAVFPPETHARLLTRDVWSAAGGHDPWRRLHDVLRRAEGAGPLERILYADRKLYLADDILVKVDRASMLASLEVRSPFLDHPLVEFVSSLPASLLWRRGAGKRLLKRAMRGLLPDETLERRKTGFGLDLPRFLGRGLEPLAREVLLDARARGRGLVDPAYVALLIDRQERRRKDLSGQIWTLILLEMWCRAWMDPPAPAMHAAA